MTDISVYLLLIDMLDSFTSTIGLLLILSSIPYLIGFVVYVILFVEEHHDAGYERYISMFKYISKIYLPVFCFCILLISLIPSSKIMYSILAVEMGDKVMQTEEAQEVFDDVKSIIKSYIPKEKD